MADEKPQTVTVETLKPHTTNGQAYDVGARYEVDPTAVSNLEHLGMAKRADAKAPAPAPAKPTK